MVKLIPGQFYGVSGKDEWNSERIEEISDAVYIRKEKIGGTRWLVFFALDPNMDDNSGVLRVRIPEEGAVLQNEKVTTRRTLVSNLLLMDGEDRKRVYPSTARSIEIAYSLVQENPDERGKKLANAIRGTLESDVVIWSDYIPEQ